VRAGGRCAARGRDMVGCPFGAGAYTSAAQTTDPSLRVLDAAVSKLALGEDVAPSDAVGSATTPAGTAEDAAAAPRGILPDEVSERGAALIRSCAEPLYYGDYLELDKILSAQHPVSDSVGDAQHDEMLFITIHQTYELWFKQILFELDSIRAIFSELTIGAQKISSALHRLLRVHEVFKILVDQVRVLETMTSQEFLNFRDYLFPASGFQSFQFRLIEIKFGVQRPAEHTARFMAALKPEHRVAVQAALDEPSLFDYVERWLRNMPFREFRGYSFQDSYRKATDRAIALDRAVIEAQIHGDELLKSEAELRKTQYMYSSVFKREVHDELRTNGARRLGFRATSSALFIALYEHEPMLHLPARLLRALVDIDDVINQWRYRHTQMVHKMIGVKLGTGGSLGFAYLRSTVDSLKVFFDLSNMSTLLLPKRLLPELPPMVRDQLKYFHSVEPYDRTLFELGSGGDSIVDWSFC